MALLGKFVICLSIKQKWRKKKYLLSMHSSKWNPYICCLWSFLVSSFSRYQILVSDGVKSQCTAEITKETILISRVPMKFTILPGTESVTGVNFKLQTVGNFTICFRAQILNQVKMNVKCFEITKLRFNRVVPRLEICLFLICLYIS